MRVKKGEQELNVSKVEGERIMRFVNWLLPMVEKFGCVHPECEDEDRCNTRDALFLDWCEPCQVWAICQNLKEIAENRGRK